MASNRARTIVTAPISKEAAKKAGFGFPDIPSS